jgi:hypothetical protein
MEAQVKRQTQVPRAASSSTTSGMISLPMSWSYLSARFLISAPFFLRKNSWLHSSDLLIFCCIISIPHMRYIFAVLGRYIFFDVVTLETISLYTFCIYRSADLLHIFSLPSAFWPFRKKHVHADIDLFSGWVRHLTTTSSNLPCKLNKESVR